MSSWLTSTAVAVAVLAKVAAGEAGVQIDTRDMGAIWQTATYQAERRDTTPVAWLRVHSGNHLAPPHGRPWVPRLSPAARAPRGWPRALPWVEKWRVRTRHLWTRARAVIEGRLEPPCRRDPMTWGSDADWARYQRLHPHAFEVRCGPTRNHFVRAW